ncbi:xylan glycosyltransferase MUCI21-like [Euphorbia lathyris]|uniref:xylan glycosyltransferase MUCI21-like n=1 Tax=Euphorbia lathyris TaxID=212925 RepID=UPI003313C4E2
MVLKNKRKYSKIGLICFIFFLLFFILQISFSSISRSTAFNSHHNPVSEQHMKSEETILIQSSTLPPPTPPPPPPPPYHEIIRCDRSNRGYDFCKIDGPTVLDPRISTFYAVDPRLPYTAHKIRPYPRKWENFTMQRIKELTLISGPSSPQCEIQHKYPAIVFSAGGYTGNFFHDFNDGLIPLYITVKSIFTDDQDFILVISKARDWWVSKYSDILQTFSKHPIINLDNDTSTHCFTSANIGLMSHGFMTINPKLLPNSQTLTHFRTFLNSAYSRHITTRRMFKKPRLVLASRSGHVARVILNQKRVKRLAEDVGFEVTVFEPKPSTPLHQAYDLINSSHAMVGVHGAALTHAVFLRPGSVFLQVVPLGNEKVAEMCFGNLGRGMELEYMEYKIGVGESSLVDKYDRNSQLIKDPIGFQGKKWSDEIMRIYLKEQNVRIDLVRFREYLKIAYKKAKKLLDQQG